MFLGFKEQIFDFFQNFDPTRPYNRPYCEKSKIIKIAIFAENSIFHKVFGIGLSDDIWPKMDPLGVLEQFCTWIWYQNPSRSNFKQF